MSDTKRKGKVDITKFNPVTPGGRLKLGMNAGNRIASSIPIPRMLSRYRGYIALAIGSWLSNSLQTLWEIYRIPPTRINANIIAEHTIRNLDTLSRYTMLFIARNAEKDGQVMTQESLYEKISNGIGGIYRYIVPNIAPILEETIEDLENGVGSDNEFPPNAAVIPVIDKIIEEVSTETPKMLKGNPTRSLQAYPSYFTETATNFIEKFRGKDELSDQNIQFLKAQIKEMSDGIHESLSEEYCKTNRKRSHITSMVCSPLIGGCLDVPKFSQYVPTSISDYTMKSWEPFPGTEKWSYDLNYDIPGCDEQLLIGGISHNTIAFMILTFIMIGKILGPRKTVIEQKSRDVDAFVHDISRNSILYSDDDDDDDGDSMKVVRQRSYQKPILIYDDDDDDDSVKVVRQSSYQKPNLIYDDDDDD